MSARREFPPVNPADLMSLTVPEQCAGCSRLEVEEASVVLLSGQRVCTYCDSWRRECELRQIEAFAVLDMADRPTRLAHLEARERVYGAEYRRRLEAVILSTWESRRAAAASAAAEDADDAA